MGEREFDYKVHRNRAPRAVRNVKRLKESVGFMTRCFVACIQITRFHVRSNIAVHSGPGKIAFDKVISASASRMSSEYRIMVLVQNFSTEGFGNIKKTFMEHKVIKHCKVGAPRGENFAPFRVGAICGFELV
jgi:hypothetical protein